MEQKHIFIVFALCFGFMKLFVNQPFRLNPGSAEFTDASMGSHREDFLFSPPLSSPPVFLPLPFSLSPPPPSLWLQLYFSSGDSSRKRASGLENTPLPSRLLPIQASLPQASPGANKVTENTLISFSSFSRSSSLLPSHPAASAGRRSVEVLLLTRPARRRWKSPAREYVGRARADGSWRRCGCQVLPVTAMEEGRMEKSG